MTLLITAWLLQYCQKTYISSNCASSSANSEIWENIDFLKVFPKKNGYSVFIAKCSVFSEESMASPFFY